METSNVGSNHLKRQSSSMLILSTLQSSLVQRTTTPIHRTQSTARHLCGQSMNKLTKSQLSLTSQWTVSNSLATLITHLLASLSFIVTCLWQVHLQDTQTLCLLGNLSERSRLTRSTVQSGVQSQLILWRRPKYRTTHTPKKATKTLLQEARKSLLIGTKLLRFLELTLLWIPPKSTLLCTIGLLLSSILSQLEAIQLTRPITAVHGTSRSELRKFLISRLS